MVASSMKKWLVFGILALGGAGGARAQEGTNPVFTGEASGRGSAESAPFAEFAGQKFGDMKFAGANFAAPVASAALAEAAPGSQRVYRDTIYRWELGVGFTYLKFRSPAIDASMAGLNTSVTYFTKEWLGVEGNITAAAGRKIFVDDRTKYAGFTGGPKITMRHGQWEPWAHALFGIAHVNPQLAGVGKNGVAIQLGGGADYDFHPPISLRFEGDWVRTQLYSLSQNNFQVVIGVVLHL